MRQRGVTLVETMISVVIFMMMAAGLSTAVIAGKAAWEVSQNSLNVQTQVRSALWNMSRDLRQAGTGLTLAQDAASLTFSFTHPVVGPVTYTWVKDPVSGVGDVVRQTTAGNRIVARNISILSLVNNGPDVVITATAAAMSATRKVDMMTLRQKVVLR